MITNLNQRWNNRKQKYVPAGECIDPRNFDVSEINEAAAKDFVMTHHYSGSYPSARRRFGLFEKGNLAGVAVFSYPVNDRTITNVFKCPSASDGLELGRFVLLDSVKANGESWFLARCREVLKPDYVGVVSFSDDTPRTNNQGEIIFAGHLGTIYQASNASFLGRGSSRGSVKLLPDGKVLSARAIQKIRAGEVGWSYAADRLREFGIPEICPSSELARREWLKYWLAEITRPLKHPGNLKYAWSFSKSVKLDSLPYPKIKLNMGIQK